MNTKLIDYKDVFFFSKSKLNKMSDEINSLERRLEVVKEVGDNRFPTVNQRK